MASAFVTAKHIKRAGTRRDKDIRAYCVVPGCDSSADDSNVTSMCNRHYAYYFGTGSLRPKALNGSGWRS